MERLDWWIAVGMTGCLACACSDAKIPEVSENGGKSSVDGGRDGADGGSEEADSGPDAGMPAQCKERGDECLANQKRCVVEGGDEVCRDCGEGEYATKAHQCAEIPGTRLTHDFGEFTLDAAEEIDGLCQSWTLENDEGFWVNAVEMLNNGGYHHSNWLFVPDDMHDGPDGAWRCKERDYSELGAAIAGGVLFAQSTQAVKEVQKFPEGVAVYLPPHARIIGGTHMLNTRAETFDTQLTLRLYTIPAEDVEVPLAPFRLTYFDLTIPSQSRSTFSGECDLSDSPASEPGDLDMDLYYVMPHTHSLGDLFRLERFGGDADGELLFEVEGFNGEARGRAFDPPIDMHGSRGFRFTCGFENPRPENVGWGIGDQEMCVMLGFARSDYAFDALVSAGGPDGMQDGAPHFSGDCNILPLEFERGKGGL